MSGRRATIEVGREVTTKTYFDSAAAKAEIDWYRRIPWAAPQLVDADLDLGRLVIATHPVAAQHPDRRPVEQLAALLRALEAEHIHHRDVHTSNVVLTPDGPLLIDWECATTADALSYDIYGPASSGVPIPDVHAALASGYCMWWGRAHRLAIGQAWGPLPERQAS